jgi:aryl-alcohol dehydrogenase-like predicted oxidoreductase
MPDFSYFSLGRSGLRISPLVLGTDNFANPSPETDCARMLAIAIESGINLIDTSNSYASGEAERIIGRALATSGARNRVLLASKFFYPQSDDPNARGTSRKHVIEACEASLKRLQTDYIDLYQTHRPDLDTPLDETLRALDDLMRAGKIRYIGSTTAPAWFLMESLMTSEQKGFARIVSEQSPYNLLDRRAENELLPMCQRHGLGVLTWSPLAMGMLAGRYSESSAPPGDSRIALRGGIYAERVTAAGIRAGNRFAALAREYGLDPAQAAVAWVRHQPGISAPIIGPRTPAQLEAVLPAAELSLSQTFLAACDEITSPGAVTASFFNSAPWMRWKIV